MISWFEKNNKISWFIVVCISCLIFYFSSISQFPSQIQKINFYSIAYHFSIFFLLSFFIHVALIRGKRKIILVFLSILLSSLYSFLDEFHQIFVPGRTADFFDILVNLSGILFSSLIYTTTLIYRKN